VETKAIEQAMEECEADAQMREFRRGREKIKREERDQKLIEEYASHIRKLFPGCPASGEFKIANHACQKYSGRVGRSAAAKEFDPQTVALAVQAHIRHEYTNYDDLLMSGWERFEARDAVRSQVEEALNQWRGK
jgi:hypothetical protein